MSASAAPSEPVLAVVGVGLLGGSVAAAARKRGLTRRIIGFGRSLERLESAQRAGLIDEFATDPNDCDSEWDLVVVGTPVNRIAADVQRIADASRPGTVITDVGSVKRPVCEPLRESLPEGIQFVGSHPLAGSEKNGFEAADPDLFEGRVTVVTPGVESDETAVSRVTHFWESLGSRVVRIPDVSHDRTLATTSHLPHVVAAALAATLESDEVDLAATGFRDTTRIASGDPELWVSILLGNADEVLTSLHRFESRFHEFQEALRNRDADELKTLLQLAKTSRDSL